MKARKENGRNKSNVEERNVHQIKEIVVLKILRGKNIWGPMRFRLDLSALRVNKSEDIHAL